MNDGKSPGLLHKSLVQSIVEAIEGQIIEGVLKPGERLVEQAMCDRLNVSRAPLREAFRILEHHGFLENRQRKGVHVTQLSLKEAIDIYRIRASLESLATALAVTEGGTNPSALVEELRAIHAVMKDAVDRGDRECYVENNLKFHEILLLACGNSRLIEILQRFNKHTARYRIRILNTPGKYHESIKRHGDLIDAIARGDVEGAERIRKTAVLANIPLLEKTFARFSSENNEPDEGEARYEN